jgi:hypothetical protein
MPSDVRLLFGAERRALRSDLQIVTNTLRPIYTSFPTDLCEHPALFFLIAIKDNRPLGGILLSLCPSRRQHDGIYDDPPMQFVALEAIILDFDSLHVLLSSQPSQTLSPMNTRVSFFFRSSRVKK